MDQEEGKKRKKKERRGREDLEMSINNIFKVKGDQTDLGNTYRIIET